MTTTPLNHRHIKQALTTLSKDNTLDRTARTLFAKTGKQLDKQQFELANALRELNILKRKLADIRAKSKRKQAVNPNKLFLSLNDIQMGSTGPAVPILTATATLADPEEVLLTQDVATRPVDAFQAVITQLQSIVYN